MYKMVLLLFPLLSLNSPDAAAQKVQEKIDQLAKDPKTAENAAKADVYIHKKNRTIMDPSQQATQQQPATTKRKKSKCADKRQ